MNRLKGARSAKASRQPPELLDIDWPLCERIAGLPETAFRPHEKEQIDLLLDLTPQDQDVVLDMVENGAMTIGQALFERRFYQLWFLARHFATLEQHYKAIHVFWDNLDRSYRDRLQIELGIGSPWPHNDFSKRWLVAR